MLILFARHRYFECEAQNLIQTTASISTSTVVCHEYELIEDNLGCRVSFHNSGFTLWYIAFMPSYHYNLCILFQDGHSKHEPNQGLRLLLHPKHSLIGSGKEVAGSWLGLHTTGRELGSFRVFGMSCWNERGCNPGGYNSPS